MSQDKVVILLLQETVLLYVNLVKSSRTSYRT
jgi:hypothetical protein